MKQSFVVFLTFFVLLLAFEEVKSSPSHETGPIQTQNTGEENSEILKEKIHHDNSFESAEIEDHVDILDPAEQGLKRASLGSEKKGSDRSAWGFVKRYANAVKNNIINFPETLSQEAQKMGARSKKVKKVLSENVNKIGSHVKEIIVGKEKHEIKEIQISDGKIGNHEIEKLTQGASPIAGSQKQSFTSNPQRNSSLKLQNILKPEERMHPICLPKDAPAPSKVQQKNLIQKSSSIVLEGMSKVGNFFSNIPRKVGGLFSSEKKVENSVLNKENLPTQEQDLCPRKESQSLSVPTISKGESPSEGSKVELPPALVSPQATEGGFFESLKNFGRSLKFSSFNIVQHVQSLAITCRNYTRSLFKSSGSTPRRASNFTLPLNQTRSLATAQIKTPGFFQEAWQDLSQIATNFKKKNITTSFVKGIHRAGVKLQSLSSNFTSGVSSIATNAGKTIQNFFSKSSDKISGLTEKFKRIDFGKLPEAISNKGSQMYERFKRSLFFVGQVWKVLYRPFEFLKDGIVGGAGFVFEKIVFVGKGIFGGVAGIFSGLKSVGCFLFDSVSSIAGSIADFFKSFGIGLSKFMSYALIILALSLLLVVLSYLKPIISPVWSILSFCFSTIFTVFQCLFGCMSCLNRRSQQSRPKERQSQKSKRHQSPEDSQQSESESEHEEKRMKKEQSHRYKEKHRECKCKRCQDYKKEAARQRSHVQCCLHCENHRHFNSADDYPVIEE